MDTQHSPAAAAARSAIAQAQGLLLAFSNPPAGEDDAFNAWYAEHASARLTVPGILNARRYVAVQEAGPRYMACYDLESPETLRRDEYRRLSAEASQLERDMLARLPLLERRVLKLVLGGEPWTEDAPYQLTVALEPAAGTRDDFIAWYREEHIPLLLKVPGWRRARLFEQVEGDGPSFCALHELESPAVFDTEAYHAATSTPWRDRVLGGVTRRERHLWQLFRTFPRPSWGAA